MRIKFTVTATKDDKCSGLTTDGFAAFGEMYLDTHYLKDVGKVEKTKGYHSALYILHLRCSPRC